jgi:hypothetical protein
LDYLGQPLNYDLNELSSFALLPLFILSCDPLDKDLADLHDFFDDYESLESFILWSFALLAFSLLF